MKRNIVLFAIAILLVLTLALPTLLPASTEAPVDNVDDGARVSSLVDFGAPTFVADPDCPHTGGQSCGG